MSLALYRKYRPRTFAEIIGQEHVTEPLMQALRTGRLHHAYLFSGPRGCGKTSSARILARSLNCERGPTPTPCGECESCRALAPDGPGSIDVIEIDAASHGGVDDARDLRERAWFAPVSSRFKVYVIDEAHMVSPAGFNALLKLVEEPPDYVKFVFATTEPEKVLGTIKSRTHHYPFRLIPPGVLRPYLEKLCEAEGVAVQPAVFPLVVRAGAGSARDALSVLDQLIAGAGPEGVMYARAVALLGVTDVALLDEVCDALAAGDGATAYATIDKVIEAGHDPRRFAGDLLDRFRDLIVAQQVPDAVEKGLIGGADDELARITAQAARFGPATLSRMADIVHTGLTDMRGTTAPRLVLELIVARMLLPGAEDSTAALLQRLERMERRVALADGEPASGRAAGGGRTAGGQPAPDQAPGTGDAASAATGPEPAPAVATGPGKAPGSRPGAQPDRSAAAEETDAAPAAGAGAAGAGRASPGGAGISSSAMTISRTAAPAAGMPSVAAPAPAAPAGTVADAAGTGGEPAPQPGPGPGAPGAAGLGAVDVAMVRRYWDEVLTVVRRKKARVGAWAREATVREVDGSLLVLVFQHAFHAQSLSASPEPLVEALYEVLGVRWKIICEVGGQQPGAPPAVGSGVPVPARGASRGAGRAAAPAVAEPAVDEVEEEWPTPAPLGGSGADPQPPAGSPTDSGTGPHPPAASDTDSGAGTGGGGAAVADAPPESTGAHSVGDLAAGDAGSGAAVGAASLGGDGPALAGPAVAVVEERRERTPPGTATAPKPRERPSRSAAVAAGDGRAAARAVAGRAQSRRTGAGSGSGGRARPGRPAEDAWAGAGADEPPYDPDYDGPPRGRAVLGFDPGDEPLDDVDDATARQTSEQQALDLLRQTLGAEKIGEM
jgi:DNA polymerase-3 subunit gamma/tau